MNHGARKVLSLFGSHLSAKKSLEFAYQRVQGSIQRFLYSATPAKHRRILLTLAGEGVRVYDAEFVRLICRDINTAKDNPQKEQELISLLQAVIKEDHEEMRIRMAFLAKKYAAVISDGKAADCEEK
jgi:hypothetical protein